MTRQHAKITRERSEKLPAEPEVIELFRKLVGAGPLPPSSGPEKRMIMPIRLPHDFPVSLI
jgi:hypothetical protein